MRDQTDDLLDEAFAGFTAAAGPYVHPAGMAPVRATVRRRRTTRLAAGTVAAAIAVVAPFAYLARSDRHTPVPMASPSASPSDSPAPTSSPVASSAGPAVTDGPTTTQQSKPVNCTTATPTATFTPLSLCNATVIMPSTACGPGKAVLVKGTTPIANSGVLILKRALQADVNGDGAPDVVALFDCVLGDPAYQEVVAFTRAAGSTTIRTIGLVVGIDAVKDITGASDLAVDPSGGVRVFVNNLHGSDGTGYAMAVNQWRTYAWNGTTFTQTGGHTSFVSDKTTIKLDLTVGKIVVDAAKQRASVTATVHNRGTTSSGVLTVYGYLGYPAAPGACPGVDHVGVYLDMTEVCSVGELAAGKSKTVTLIFSTSGNPPTFNGDEFVQLRVGDQEYTFENHL